MQGLLARCSCSIKLIWQIIVIAKVRVWLYLGVLLCLGTLTNLQNIIENL